MRFFALAEEDHAGLQPDAGTPVRTGEKPIPIRDPTPTLGQDNDYMLEEVLGLSAEDLSELANQDIFGTEPPLPNQ